MSLCFEVFTLFPGAIEGFVGAGLLGKAIEQGLVTVRCTDFRDFTTDRHRTVDDAPFGGGAGMVIKPRPVVDAMEHVARERGPFHRVLLTPSAPRFDQRAAARLARLPRVGLLCGRYEGIDDRVREHYVDECLSLGDFVLGGGEVAALVIIEAISRLVEGVVGNPESVHTDSFGRTGDVALLEHPHYTRPARFRGHAVPPVLLGGDHAAIARWRHRQALGRTWALRPELRPHAGLAPDHPIHLAVPPAALEHAAQLAAVARHHGVVGLAVVGAGPEALPRWLEATGGRIAVAVFADPKTLRRRLARGLVGGSAAGAEARFVRVVSRSEPFVGVEPPCEHAAALLDLLASELPRQATAAPLGPLVLWPHIDEPPSGVPIHAIYAPSGAPAGAPQGASAGAPTEMAGTTATVPSAGDLTPDPNGVQRQALAIEHAIADSSRPRSRTAALAHAALTELRDRG
ncbi:tRNA (guanosine(37)-N1)-methyltransferase TrmD [Paraliomyxa miuraensis]|uniref:tRNA (guanosine(37)-N1)-methyltransferase TrmD n=1 Tax=Paraliomyxa miuraensis TaxID=376150 RepID=UPI0022556BD4|nr:tRNA (guanosine(37)-N1)-methyltransferase TrmD [Paraliomyxa miuraensis]MCX4239212.1 tRNA (guanosine(37)-N1)-methyltransferase TrmD [Paraliomyxa miuraensis]